MHRDIDINVLIAVRGGSKRIPGKNTRPFGGASMLELKIQQALRLKEVSAVVVTSEDDSMLQIAEDLGAVAMKRDSYYASDTVPMGEVYVHLASSLSCKDVLWTPVTSPLVTDKTIQECITFYKTRPEFDSVVTTNLVKEYMWLGDKAINYDPLNHPRSQDLPDVYALNFAANILSREMMIKNRNIIGDKFYPYMIDDVESVDVDTEFDFVIAEFLYNNRGKDCDI
tara:strand:+ start:41631 stop:42308 length:678 start_codon:yes stop_codon:yes gene_type:complete